MKLQKYYLTVCLLFLLSKARQAKRKFKVKNYATKMTKNPKQKLPKFVMSRALHTVQTLVNIIVEPYMIV